MGFLSKLKAETSINMLLPAIVSIAGLILLWKLFGRQMAFNFIAAVVLIYSVFSFSAFIKTRSLGYLLASIFQLIAGFAILSGRGGPLHFSQQVTDTMWYVVFIFMIWMQILLMTRRFKWRGREILELAAAPVEDITNGFTERPRPLGKTTFSREEVLAFARFASENLIAMPYTEPDRVVLVSSTMAQSFRYLYPWRRDYSNDTWIAFGNDGEVTVNVAKADYLKYKDSLSFDQLCESLGNLFIEFVELFKRGEGVRVIDRMNALRINPYT